jgi:hypothetical protein
MSDEENVVIVEPPPAPDLDDVQQVEPVTPAVPVKIEGPVRVQQVPNRSGPAFTHAMTTQPSQVLGEDMRRARAQLWADEGWLYRRRTGGPVTVAANAIIDITHCDEVWASVSTETGTLNIITEYFAQ